jgi:hypothetical protein
VCVAQTTFTCNLRAEHAAGRGRLLLLLLLLQKKKGKKNQAMRCISDNRHMASSRIKIERKNKKKWQNRVG